MHYRVVGGPVGVDQRLSLFEEGSVELDERHRTRDATLVTIGAGDLQTVCAELDQLPEDLWSSSPKLWLLTRRVAWQRFLGRRPQIDLGARFFQLKRGRRYIAGELEDRDPRLTELLDFLESLRAAAVRRAEVINPT